MRQQPGNVAQVCISELYHLISFNLEIAAAHIISYFIVFVSTQLIKSGSKFAAGFLYRVPVPTILFLG